MSDPNTQPTADTDADLEHSDTARTVPLVVATIHKSAVEHLPVVVAPHELLVLALVHGSQEKIQIEDDADLPSGLTEKTFEPEDEYVRLEQLYGNHTGTGQSYASMVFGSVEGFVERLDQIEAGRAPSARTTRAKAAKTAAAKAPRRS